MWSTISWFAKTGREVLKEIQRSKLALESTGLASKLSARIKTFILSFVKC